MNLTPKNNTNLLGFNNFFLNLKKLHDQNLLPNKIIFSGDKGIGKSTLAFHLTNYIYSVNEKNKYNIKSWKILLMP